MAQHFFPIGCDMITQKANQTYIFVKIEDLGFPVSREDAYYQFYKNAPIYVSLDQFSSKNNKNSEKSPWPIGPRTLGPRTLSP